MSNCKPPVLISASFRSCRLWCSVPKLAVVASMNLIYTSRLPKLFILPIVLSSSSSSFRHLAFIVLRIMSYFKCFLSLLEKKSWLKSGGLKLLTQTFSFKPVAQFLFACAGDRIELFICWPVHNFRCKLYPSFSIWKLTPGNLALFKIHVGFRK